MEIVILRKDPAWTIKSRPPLGGMPIRQLQRLRQRFHEIAQQNGSHATWLPETGFLVTEDDNEPARRFPYEQWLMQAQKETGSSTTVLPTRA